jgi:hypothetical protein
MFEIPPLSDRSPLPLYIQPLTLIILITTLSISPKYSLRRLFLLALATAILAVLPFYSDGEFGKDYWNGCSFAARVFLAIDFLFLSTPERDFWKVPRSEEAAKEQQLWQGGKWSWKKWWWSAGIWMTARGTGWSWEVKNIGPKPAAGYPAW